MRRARSIVLPLSLLLAAACSSASSTPEKGHLVQGASRGAATSFTPWWTYHRTPDRAGHATAPVGGPLRHAWSKKLGAAVYGEPLVVGTTLIVATERNQVFGLNASTGHVRWKTGLGRPQPMRGLPCGDIDPLGITGTPAYDPKTGSVFMVAETVGGHHTLWSLAAATGHRRWHTSLDVLPHRNRKAE
jgi:outer membrane protein assembly factor BamB